MTGIEISDVGIAVAVNGQLLGLDHGLASSPGFLLEQSGIHLGAAAEAGARIYPTRSRSDFWDQLDNQPLTSTFAGCTSRAEMAYLHLRFLAEQLPPASSIALAVPAHYGADQLGLLIGMAAELSLPVHLVMDRALAMPETRLEKAVALVDLHLHCGSISLISAGEKTQVQTLAEIPVGLASLIDDSIKWIADAFVQQTRFDPLHDAQGEQELYNRVQDVWAGMSRGAEFRFDMTLGGRTHSALLERAEFNRTCGRVGVAIREAMGQQDADLEYWFTHRAGLVPSERQTPVLEPGAGAIGAAAMLADTSLKASPGASRVTVRHWAPLSEAPTQAMTSSVHTGVPTHVVYRGRAMAIGSLLSIGREGTDLEVELTKGVSREHCLLRQENGQIQLEDKSTYGTSLDDQPLNGGSTACSIGQTIRLAKTGEALLLIEVEGSRGA